MPKQTEVKVLKITCTPNTQTEVRVAAPSVISELGWPRAWGDISTSWQQGSWHFQGMWFYAWSCPKRHG